MTRPGLGPIGITSHRGR